jgi:hypothetical protein
MHINEVLALHLTANIRRYKGNGLGFRVQSEAKSHAHLRGACIAPDGQHPQANSCEPLQVPKSLTLNPQPQTPKPIAVSP